MQYTCVRCGRIFEANVRTAVCSDCHTGVCVVCGKPFELKSPYTAVTCSPKCRGQYVKMSGISKQGFEKRKQQNLEKYGVEHYFQTSECREKTAETNLQRYGVKHAMQNPGVVQKGKQTNLQKYGVENVSQDAGIKQKIKSTLTERYGGIGLAADGIKAKAQATNVEKYGDVSPLSNDEVKAKIAKTNLERYGAESPLSNDSSVKQKIYADNLQRYGAKSQGGTTEVRQKMQATMRQRYGKDWYLQTDSRLQSTVTKPEKFEKYSEFVEDPRAYLTKYHKDEQVTLKELNEELGITFAYAHIIKHNCQDLIHYQKSVIEDELFEFLKSIVPVESIQRNCRSLITPKEVDFYLSEYHLAIECNPTCTHQSSVIDPWGADPKPYKYHLQKSLDCRQKGVFLFHIFGWEWKYKKEIILSMLKNLLHKCDNKIYARNTEVREVPYKECKEFLEKNHRQGNIVSNIRLGLYCKDQLVSVMTLNKPRMTIGNENVGWELGRFCSLLNTSIVGGASKLFKYFVKHYSPESIVSYSDNAHTQGNLYKVLGFKKTSISEPGYMWANFNEDHFTRNQCQKQNLKKLFKDNNLDSSQTESEIMVSHGYYQVFDCGSTKWIWNSADKSL